MTKCSKRIPPPPPILPLPLGRGGVRKGWAF